MRHGHIAMEFMLSESRPNHYDIEAALRGLFRSTGIEVLSTRWLDTSAEAVRCIQVRGSNVTSDDAGIGSVKDLAQVLVNNGIEPNAAEAFQSAILEILSRPL